MVPSGFGGGDSTRRRFLGGLSVGLAGLAATRPGRAIAGPPVEDPPLIVRSRRPLDAETPVEVFAEYLTPNRLFFARSHLGLPSFGPDAPPWTVEVDGEVGRPLRLSLGELEAGGNGRATVTAVLQCSGNGRSFYSPTIPGVGWERGAVGNAEWEGVRLADLLERAGLKKRAGHVHFLGADLPPHPKTPVYLRSLPMEKALDPDTILAVRMNGDPLPTFQGGPVRLVVPGWFGNHWLKWVRRITVSDQMAPGFYMQTAYRIPKVPAPPGADVKPEDLGYVEAMNVKSLIAGPSRGAVLPVGRHEVRGVSWTGLGRVARVEVAIGDDGPWREAELVGPDRPFAWRQWRLAWEATGPGRVAIRSRATDSKGEAQPEASPWNRSGYAWNAIDRVEVEVRRS